jgi:lipoyl(octanoyl) transferase
MKLQTYDLGLIDYPSAWEFQKKTFQQVKNKDFNFALVSCRHYPVITLGRGAKRNNILASQEELADKRITTYPIERGGDVTYHGPGQLTIYPIFNLAYLKKDIHWFLRKLEGIIINCLADFGVEAKKQAGLTGVWAGKQKIASLGIAIKNWISFHGLSMNIGKDDLINFGLIRPCGMDIEVTSLESKLGKAVNITEIQENLIHKFEEGF